MNTQFFRYMVEVERTGSITQASENLYMAQPNLSRIIKEVEDDLGFPIFKRSSKGVIPTAKGEVFLEYAESILEQLEEMELLFSGKGKRCLKIAIPRGSAIPAGLSSFLESLEKENALEIKLQGTSTFEAIRMLVEAECHLGVIRYPCSAEKRLADFLKERQIKSEPLWEYRQVLLFSYRHPLAKKQEISSNDLKGYLEIFCEDPCLPFLEKANTEKKKTDLSGKSLFCDSGEQFSILQQAGYSYMWTAPVQKEILDRHGLVQRGCAFLEERFQEALLYSEKYRFTDTARKFVQALRGRKLPKS